MARVVVDVMPKPEILDPQGKAVQGRCPGSASTASATSGRASASSSRSTARPPTSVLAQVHEMAATLLSNPVIEDYDVAGGGDAMKIGVVTFPGSLDDVDAQRAVRIAGDEPSPLWHGDHDLRGRRRGRAAGRLLLRRLPALRRDRPVRAGDDRGRRGGRAGHAGARHLQRLPDPVRVPPAARRADPQRPPQVRLPRPAAADREQPDRLDHGVRRRPRDHHRAQERRGRLRRRRATRSTGSRARAGSSPATSTTTPTARCATSPASPTSAATSSA